MTGHWPRWIFLRVLGLVLLAACLSFWVQARGLVGENGIVPAGDALARVGAWLDEQERSRWLEVPTLGWWGAGNAALDLLCLLGCTAAGALLLGWAPRVALALGWVAYLSLFHLAGPFLGFQWDILLLETLLVAIPYAPGGLRPRDPPDAHPIALWAVRLLLFKLIFSSGVVKLTSGDPTWADGTALDYHYWTQPLPHIGGWLAHQAPLRWLGVTLTFVVELVAPLLIVADVRGWRLAAFGGVVAAVVVAAGGHLGLGHVPWLALAAGLLDERLWRWLRPASAGPRRSARTPAAVAIAGLMLLISATGSYGFFQLLTLALCVTLLDDATLRCPPRPVRVASPWLAAAFATVILPVSALQMTGLAGRKAEHEARLAVEAGTDTDPQRWLVRIADAREATLEITRPFASVNSYGLFATMTRDRFEIVVEGSADGVTDWRPYGFRYKPGDPHRVGAMAGLHMPRLDWQLWFAALSPSCRRGWYPGFIQALQRGTPAVRGLLAHDPFGGRPPRAIRSRRVRYTFTDAARYAADGAFWITTDAGSFCPTFTRSDWPEM